MRTTVTFDADTAAAIERLRRDRGAGISTVVNELIRRGLTEPEPRARFVQATSPGGALVDVTNIGEVLDLLDEIPGG